jgi:penicillin-binding protein 2
LRVVNDESGTGREARDELLRVAGKTGTAEAAQTRVGASPELAQWLQETHAWFALYAPVPDPQVVIVVFVEHGGGGGHDAAPLARRIFEAWRRLGLYRVPPPEPEGDAPPGAAVEPPPAAPGTPALPDDRTSRGGQTSGAAP